MDKEQQGSNKVARVKLRFILIERSQLKNEGFKEILLFTHRALLEITLNVTRNNNKCYKK